MNSNLASTPHKALKKIKILLHSLKAQTRLYRDRQPPNRADQDTCVLHRLALCGPVEKTHKTELKPLKNKYMSLQEWLARTDSFGSAKRGSDLRRSLAGRQAGTQPRSSRGKQKNTEASHQNHTFSINALPLNYIFAPPAAVLPPSLPSFFV